MDDPLDQLSASLKRHTPPTRDAAREAALHAAMENFSTEVQGSAEEARHTSDRPQRVAGFWTGVTTMLTRLTTPRALMGTTALATCAIAVLVAQNHGPDTLLGGDDYVIREPATEDVDVIRDAEEIVAPPQTLELRDGALLETERPAPPQAAIPVPLARSQATVEPAEAPVATLDAAPEQDAVAEAEQLQAEPAAPEPVAAAAQFRLLEIEASVSSGVLGFLRVGDRIDLYWTRVIDGQRVTILVASDLEVTRFTAKPPENARARLNMQQIEVNVPLSLYETISEASATGRLSASYPISDEMAALDDNRAQGLAQQNLFGGQGSLESSQGRVLKRERNGSQVTIREIPREEAEGLGLVEVPAERGDVIAAAPQAPAIVAPALRGPQIAPFEMVDQAEGIAPSANFEYSNEDITLAPTPGATTQGRPAVVEQDSVQRLVQTDPADAYIQPEADTEAYPTADVNAIKRVADEPVSTFSIDVDTASYGVMRSSLQGGHLPPKGSVRVEELVNYFDYAYPRPESVDVPFATSVSVAETPWNPDTQLLHIGIQGYEDIERPPLNLVFLIDTSGSMGQPNKLPLLVASFKLLVESLAPTDSIAIVTYAGSAGMALAPTPVSDQASILSALDRLGAGGSTAGQAGLQQAYGLAEQMAEEGEISRVILATDGDFNVGLSNPEALKDFIADKRETGTYLSVLGFGRGNYDDATMQALAQNGNGTAAYIDTLAEAQKVLVQDMTANLFPIAGDVKIQIEFNPAQISEYRLIGYETRALAREDFNNDAVDAGEIGAGHTVTAIYEITPKGSPAERFGELRYAQAVAEEVEPGGELAFLKLRYKRPGETRSNLIEVPVTEDRADIAAAETAFAASVAAFGQLLRGETGLGDFGYSEVLALAAANRGEDPFGYRSEFMSLVRLADALD